MMINRFCIQYFFACMLIFTGSISGQTYTYNPPIDCRLTIAQIKADTILSYGNPECVFNFTNLDTSINGYWYVFSDKDSTVVLYKVEIRNKLKEGLEFQNDFYRLEKKHVNYKNGILEGPYTIHVNNRLSYFCNYINGKINGKIYQFFYEPSHYPDKLVGYIIYNRKGKVKKAVKFSR